MTDLRAAGENSEVWHRLTDNVYLGDAVYAGVDDMGRVWTYTSDGVYVRHFTCLEPDVLVRLVRLATSDACRGQFYREILAVGA